MKSQRSSLFWISTSLAGLFGMILAGCGGKPPAPQPLSSSAAETPYQGRNLTVFIDGRRIESKEVLDGQVLYSAGLCSPNPVLIVQGNTDALGLPIQSVQATFYPAIEKKPDRTVFYLPFQTQLQLSAPTTLIQFERISLDQCQRVGELPPGDYCLVLQITGQKHWDRQTILLTIPSPKQ